MMFYVLFYITLEGQSLSAPTQVLFGKMFHTGSHNLTGIIRHWCRQSMLVVLPSPTPLPLSRDGLNALSVHRACNCSSWLGSFAQGEDICILYSCKKCELGLFLD